MKPGILQPKPIQRRPSLTKNFNLTLGAYKKLIKRSKRPKVKSKRKRRPKLRKELEALQKQLTIAKYGNDCFTCPQKNLQKTNCQLGHVPWPRSILSVPAKFSTDYTRIQCYSCNINKGGMGGMASMRMREEGIDLQHLWDLSFKDKGKPFNIKWFQTKIEEYKALLITLER